MNRNILVCIIVSSATTTVVGDFIVFYEGNAYDTADSPFVTSDYICGAVTFPMPLPTVDGTPITPTVGVLQTSENGAAGFSSSNLLTTTFTWDATNNVPQSWNFITGTSLVGDTLQTRETVPPNFADGDSAIVGAATTFNLMAGNWFATLPARCASGAHPAVAAAVPEPSAFMFLALVGTISSGIGWYRNRASQ